MSRVYIEAGDNFFEPSLGFESQMQSTALQHKLHTETEGRASTAYENDETCNITAIEQQISSLETAY